MLLATSAALANFKPMCSVLSAASGGRSNWLMISSTAARFSFEFAVTMSAFEFGSLVMRTLP